MRPASLGNREEAAAVAAAREAEEAEASLAKLEAIDPRVTEAAERGTEIGGSSSATTWTWHEGWAPRQEWSWHEGWATRELGWWAEDWSEGWAEDWSQGWASHERSSTTATRTRRDERPSHERGRLTLTAREGQGITLTAREAVPGQSQTGLVNDGCGGLVAPGTW